jgi:hypothetical protein
MACQWDATLLKKVLMIFVREADDVKVVQRFIAGFGRATDLSPGGGRLKAMVSEKSISVVRFTELFANLD